MKKQRTYINNYNRKARYDFEFIRTLNAGIKLLGSEVKGIRDLSMSFVDSFCIFTDDGIELRGLHIDSPGWTEQHDPVRNRVLLLKKKEITKLKNEFDTGMSIVPVRLFETERGLFKLEIALARGKKTYDKRESIKERDIKRETEKQLNERNY